MDSAISNLGPNTAAPLSVLSGDCILCSGEDRQEFLAALRAAGLNNPRVHSQYRGYEFWRFDSCSAILTGIGTGCLEPALWEILQPGVVKRIVLVGTAGTLPGATVETGKAFLIDRAWPAGTGIDAMALDLPLRPSWNVTPNLPTATSVSTDFYYGFSPKLGTAAYPLQHSRLQEMYDRHIRDGTELVEMEVAQFYFFCGLLGDKSLQYAAVKIPVNSVSQVEQQLENSPGALVGAVRAVVEMLVA